MALFNIAEAVDSNFSLRFPVVTILVLLILYPIFQIVYNVFFHPLAKIPGPFLWSASRIPFVYHLLRGSLIKSQRRFHNKYGPVFRMAPDEVSFASEEAFYDIYTWRAGHKRAMRDPAFFQPPEGQADNLITTNNVKFHARIRGLMSHSFTEESLYEQAPLIEGHADVLISQLQQRATSSENLESGALVNVTDWVNFFTMDVIGDLALGEDFGCLVKGEYHDWIRTLFQYLKAMTIAAAPRYWPVMQFLFEKAIPKSIKDDAKRHQQYAYDRINRRLDSKTDRQDFITPFMKHNPNFENMSREEILSSFSFVIIGGTETIATSLTGLFNHLAMPQNKAILDRLTKEIRSTYKTEDDITVESITRAKLPYLEAVIQEGLRICHPVPSGLPRIVPPGGDEYTGIWLPGGTRLGVRIFAVNRSAKYFQDPDTFVPDRWLPEGERPSEYDNDNLSASKPFGVGFHSCLGKLLALVEIRLVLTRILWAFDIAEEEGMHVHFDDFPVMMMVEKQPLMLRLSARKGVNYKAAGVNTAQ